LNICIAFSPNWFKYILISLFALLKTNKSPIKVYLLSDNLSSNDFLALNKLFSNFDGCEYKYFNLLEKFNKFINNVNVSTKFTKYTLYRLFIPYIISETKLLYLDADTVVNGDISQFYNMNMEDYWIAGCEDTGLQRRYKTSIGLKENDIYINAGVCLMNLSEIRQNRLGDKWLRLINEKFYLAHDQDVLNITCNKHIKNVDFDYNVSLSTNVNLNTKNIKIMHYAGNKPWDTTQTPFNEIWKYWENEYLHYLGNYKPSIPRIIHYCWFGENEKPDLVKKCISSWKAKLKDYLIIEWNENNFDINIHQFVKKAYDKKLYAFCNDWVRMWAMYHYGGISLDTDVEVLKPLDKFLEHKCFTGHETIDIPVCAIIGSIPGHPWIKKILDYYDDNDVELNYNTPNTQIIKKLSKNLLDYEANGYTYMRNNVVVYPQEVFAPYDHSKFITKPTKESYTVHHFQRSWLK